jgi:hypothetical protein
MKFTFWKYWLRNRLSRFCWPSRARVVAQSACVALGLATAWGGEAQADITFRTEITPAHDLLDAFVYYGNNATGGGHYPLGPLTAGETHIFLHHYPELLGFYVDDTPEYYEPDGRFPIGFGIGGIYEHNGMYGLTVSYVDSSPVDIQQSWQEFFDFDIGYPFASEANIVADYLAELEHAPRHWERTPLGGVYSSYTGTYNDRDGPELFREKRLLTPYGTSATLISFGDTRFAGTAIVTIIAEPSSAVLLFVTLGGAIAAIWFRR